MRYHILCKSILKCKFSAKGIKLTLFVLLRYLECLSFEVPPLGLFGRYHNKICKIQVRLWNKKFSVLDKLVRLCICYQHRVFPLPWWYFPIRTERFRQSENFELYVLRLWVEGIIFSWWSRGFSLTERNLKKWILLTKNFWIRRCSRYLSCVTHSFLNS